MTKLNLALIMAGAALSACSPSATERAQELVKRDMFDPDAAQFRSVKNENGGKCVTGEANGKNKFGAYVGFRRFIVNLENEKVAFEPSEAVSDSAGAIAAARVNVVAYECDIKLAPQG